ATPDQAGGVELIQLLTAAGESPACGRFSCRLRKIAPHAVQQPWGAWAARTSNSISEQTGLPRLRGGPLSPDKAPFLLISVHVAPGTRPDYQSRSLEPRSVTCDYRSRATRK